MPRISLYISRMGTLKLQNLFVLHFLVQLKHVQDLHCVAAVSGGMGGLDWPEA